LKTVLIESYKGSKILPGKSESNKEFLRRRPSSSRRTALMRDSRSSAVVGRVPKISNFGGNDCCHDNQTTARSEESTRVLLLLRYCLLFTQHYVATLSRGRITYSIISCTLRTWCCWQQSFVTVWRTSCHEFRFYDTSSLNVHSSSI